MQTYTIGLQGEIVLLCIQIQGREGRPLFNILFWGFYSLKFVILEWNSAVFFFIPGMKCEYG